MKRINTLRTLGVSLATVAASLLMAGCFDNPLEPDKDDVTITLAVTTPITAGSSGNISGKVEGSEVVTISFAVTDSNGTAVASNLIRVDYTTVNEDKVDLATESQAKVHVADSACDGEYTLTITAAAGSATLTKSKAFTVSGGDCGTAAGTTPVTEADVTLGASQSSNGSAYDADADNVYTSGMLTSNTTLQATVDVYFGVTGTSNTPKLGSAYWANASGWGTWTGTPPDTKFLKVTGTYADLDTQEKIDALWTDTGAANSVTVSAGDLIVVKTTEGAYALIQVVSATTNTSGDAVLKVKIKQ